MKDDLWKRHNHVEPKVNIINIQSTTRNLKFSNKSSTISRNISNSTPNGILSMMRNKSSSDSSLFRNTKYSVGFD